jgi:NAD(P)-dependent dehydrogenase (short-subunit alcohol dehydrogenase family)
MGDFDGQVALVTGGASGIGEAIASSLRARGAEVAVLDAAPASDSTPAHLAVHADVIDDASVEAAVAAVIERFGRLDIVVNNAGIGAQGTVETNPLDEWRRVLDVNLLGMVRVSRAALPHLRSSGRGAIVNTASVAADVGLPDRVLYSASKGAVVSASRAMAADLIDEGVRVCWVCPGTADTPWIGRLLERADDPAAERAALEARQPHGRLVSAGEVAEAVCYLASAQAGSTTGTGLTVDGGLTGLRLRR